MALGSLGSLVVSLAANTAQFTEDLGKAAHESAKRMGQMRRDAQRAGKAIGLMFSAGVGVSALLVKQSIDAADAMHKMAQGAGVATTTMSELAFVFRLGGVDATRLSASLALLNKNVSDTAAGTGEARMAFAALGIEMKDVDGNLKSADRIIDEVADKFAGMEDGAGKSAIAVKIFGEQGKALIPTLNQGADGIGRLREEARQLGDVMDGPTAMAAELFNDNLTRLNSVKRGLANQIMRELVPSLNNLTDQLVDSAKHTDLMGEASRIAATGVRILLTGAVAGAAAFKFLGDLVGQTAAILVSIGKGEFRQAVTIWMEGADNLEAVVNGAMKNIDAIWRETGKTIAETTDSIVKQKAPLIANAQEVVAAQRAEAKAIADQQRIMKAANEARKEARETQRRLMDEQKRAIAEGLAAAEQEAFGRVEAIRQSLLTEQELLAESHEAKLIQLEEALSRRVLTEQQYDEMRLALQADYEKRAEAIAKKGWTERQKFAAMSMRQQASTIFGELANITAGVSQHNRKLFELNKVAGIANAILNAYTGISKTLATYPFPLNIAMAAAHAVSAFAQVSAIQGTQFGSSAAAPSLAGGTPAAPVTPVQSGTPQGGPEQATIIKIEGDVFSGKQLRELIDKLNEGRRDGGGRLVLA